MNSILNLASASYSRSLKNYMSYKFNFFGEILFSLVSVMFIFFVSEIFSNNESEYLEKYNGNYFLFLFTGLGVIFFITRTFTAMIQFASEAQTFGYLESIVSTKTPFHLVLLLAMLFPLTQAIIRVCLIYAFSFLFTYDQISINKFFELIILLNFVVMPFIGICFCFISVLIMFKRASFLFSLFLMGCSVFSGIFYPIEVMPSFLSNFSVLFPSTYSIDLIRERILEETSYSLLLNEFIFILFTSVLYYFVGLVTLKYSIYYAKIKGNLSHF